MQYHSNEAQLSVLNYSGLLIGCGKKREILRHFQGKLCSKKGPLCGKLCDFFNIVLLGLRGGKPFFAVQQAIGA